MAYPSPPRGYRPWPSHELEDLRQVCERLVSKIDRLYRLHDSLDARYEELRQAYEKLARTQGMVRGV